MGVRKAPHWVRDHWILHIEEGNDWAYFACRHCIFDFQFRQTDKRLSERWLHLADHLFLGHDVLVRELPPRRRSA